MRDEKANDLSVVHEDCDRNPLKLLGGANEPAALKLAAAGARPFVVVVVAAAAVVVKGPFVVAAASLLLAPSTWRSQHQVLTSSVN